MGYDFTGGRIFDFPIDFSMGLTTVQRYCAACDVLADVTVSLSTAGLLTFCIITNIIFLSARYTYL